MLDQRGVEYSGLSREWGGSLLRHPINHLQMRQLIIGVVTASLPLLSMHILMLNARNLYIGAGFIEMRFLCIRARRTGNHDFSSQDVGLKCGDAVWERLLSAGKTPVVDLTTPDKEIFVEVRQKEAYVFTENSRGVGGLPLGTQGKMVALVSGGIDPL
jgi:thiamine biosynthesis protein ThiI